MTFTIERICGIILILIFGVLAFYFQKRYFYLPSNPMNGFSITKSKYQNLLFSWVLAGVGVSVYLLAGFFEAQFTQYWNFEITPIIILATGFILGPFYGFLVGVIGNLISVLLTPGLAASSIQFLLTWIRGLLAFSPLLFMIIHFKKTNKFSVLFLRLIVIYFVTTLWTVNFIIILKPSVINLGSKDKNIAISAMVGISVIMCLLALGAILQYYRAISILLVKRKFRNSQTWRRKRSAVSTNKLHIETRKISKRKKKKNNYLEIDRRHWKLSIAWSSILTMTVFYILVYYVFGGFIVGTQILHIKYSIYILYKTPSWLLSWSCSIIILYYFLVVISKSKMYDFVLIKLKKQFFSLN